jgi:hypothetical protein
MRKLVQKEEGGSAQYLQLACRYLRLHANFDKLGEMINVMAGDSLGLALQARAIACQCGKRSQCAVASPGACELLCPLA